MPSLTSCAYSQTWPDDEDRAEREGEEEPLDHAPLPNWPRFRVRYGWQRSAAKTPNWQVNDDEHEDDRVDASRTGR